MLTSSHWGVGLVRTDAGRIVAVEPHPDDPEPSPINQNIAGSLNGDARVLRPAVRASWLDHGPSARRGERGREPFVEVEWERALDLVAGELERVRQSYGNNALFAGSYGWSSAGRFHHAQTQLRRFLNTVGGFVGSDGNYSYNAALKLMPYIVGPFRRHVMEATRWSVIGKHTDLVVMFGGMAARNTQVSDGGVSRHRMLDNLKACAAAGVRFVNLSPLRSDADDVLNAKWLPPHPGSDTAVMMGLAYVLLQEGLHDQAFLSRYTVGFERISAYLKGDVDGVAKTPSWAEEQSGVGADAIVELAHEMAKGRTMIATAAGLQRADYGEQPLWMTVTLAAMLGQIGLPGGGYTIGYGVNANIGNVERLFRWGALPQGRNPVSDTIPVAMITEMLLNPGGEYSYQGTRRSFPHARLMWWAGGNPFHHHQDLNRLRRGFQTPQTIIVNEINWTATARHADIVLPVAASQERNDFGGGKSDNALIPMPAAAEPPGQARTEFEIYAALAERLGTAQAFTADRTEWEWLEELWEDTRVTAREHQVRLPDFGTFMDGDIITVPDPAPNQVFLDDFRRDPDANALPTPSGRIELFCETIAQFNLADCPGHPVWMPPRDVAADLGELYLLSGQPKTRLHSQLDNGSYSLSHKVADREPVLIHPKDAHDRGIRDGDVVELFNARGRCLAGARVTDEVREGCVFLWTGAWYDPDFEAVQHRDRHGNPNVLTHDLRSSSLTQSPASHSARISLQRWTGAVPPVQAHGPPPFRAAAAPTNAPRDSE
ncbi:MAG: molybdopterin-dependent oxidoreductase [Pseudomonadota bacterium]